MANTYDLHNPKHFCFNLENAYDEYDEDYDSLLHSLHVEIFPLKHLRDSSFDQYEEKDYCSPDDGGIDFTWAPGSMFDADGELHEGYECGFEFDCDPSILEADLRSLGLVSIDEDR